VKKFCFIALAGLLVFFLQAAAARAERPPIMKTDDVKPGMKGYALTVFHGTKPQRFNIEVIGVLHNFAPKRNIIIVRCSEDPNVDYNGDGKIDDNDKFITKGGIAQGMSGSPAYVVGDDGKDYLIGAVAMGWQFSVDPMAGVTPIEQMIADMETPLEKAYAPPAAEGSASAPEKEAADDPLAPYRSKLQYLSTPLVVSGFNERVFNAFAEELRKHNIEALQGGGADGAEQENVQLEPGSTVGVPLVRGDMEVYAFGTLTMLDGNKIVAFGHPFMGSGECKLPITAGSITTILTSRYSSFKLGGSVNQVGVLLRDRTSSVSGELTEEKDSVRMIPLTIRTAVKKNRESGEAEYKTYKMEIADFEPLLANIVYYCATNVVTEDLPAAGDATSYTQMKFKFEGYDEVTTWDSAATASGSAFSINMAKMLAVLIMNPYHRVKLEYVDITVDLTRELRAAVIQEVVCDAKEAKPGEEVTLKLKLKGYEKGEWWEEMKVQVPEDVKGDSIDLVVEGGNSANADMADAIMGANSVGDMLDFSRELFKPNAFVATIKYDSSGIRYKSHMLKQLPPSVVKQFQSVAGYDATAWPDMKRIVKEYDWVVEGSTTIHLKINRKEN
jgi:acyl-CoA-binding protein